MKMILIRLLREPLLHFFAVGGLIFFLYANGGGSGELPPDVISISSAQIDQLAAQFNTIWRRSPTTDELNHLIDGYVREEVYYREALALGLDQNDAVVRQRMRQKIEFLTDISAQMLDPTTDELKTFLSANEKKYMQGSRRALEQVLLGQTPTQDEISLALQDLKADPANNTSVYSKRSFLPAELGLSHPEAIDSVYGNGFFDQIETFPTGEWSGPVVSAHGVHLVRVLDNEAARFPVLAEMRTTVLRDWQVDKAKELRELDYLARKERFTIEIFGRERPTGETP